MRQGFIRVLHLIYEKVGNIHSPNHDIAVESSSLTDNKLLRICRQSYLFHPRLIQGLCSEQVEDVGCRGLQL